MGYPGQEGAGYVQDPYQQQPGYEGYGYPQQPQEYADPAAYGWQQQPGYEQPLVPQQPHYDQQMQPAGLDETSFFDTSMIDLDSLTPPGLKGLRRFRGAPGPRGPVVGRRPWLVRRVSVRGPLCGWSRSSPRPLVVDP